MSLIDKRGENYIDYKTFCRYQNEILNNWIWFESTINSFLARYSEMSQGKDIHQELIKFQKRRMSDKIRDIRNIVTVNGIISNRDQESIETMMRLNSIRNIFAHNRPGCYGFTGDAGNLVIEPNPDPKNPEEDLDFQKYYEYFISNYENIRYLISKMIIPESYVL